MKTSTLPTLTLTPYRTGVTQLGLVTRTALLDLALGYRDTQLGYIENTTEKLNGLIYGWQK